MFLILINSIYIKTLIYNFKNFISYNKKIKQQFFALHHMHCLDRTNIVVLFKSLKVSLTLRIGEGKEVKVLS